ncbi:MAG: hypothetical protein IPK22_07025 [Verrucomicrobiaceae bacterium]|nr:hypothetical protein [Verrucomicrobiaceae bacterium]
MSNSNQTFSFTEFAEELLQVYQSRVAQDWVDGLAFMSTAGGRVDLLKKVQDRTATFLSLSDPQPNYSGASIEAIIGEFGSGKSHLGFLLKYHFISTAPKTLVMHCQMTGDRSVGEVWARALQNLWLSQCGSRIESGIEMSGFDALRNALAKEPPPRAKARLVEVMRKFMRKLDPTFAQDFATALLSGNASLLSEFLTAWIAKEEPLLANEALQVILGVFNHMGLAGRLVFLLDEVEALESLDRSGHCSLCRHFRIFTMILHFVFLACPLFRGYSFRRPNSGETGRELLPSLFGERDRTRYVSAIPSIEKIEVYSLADRYALLLQLTAALNLRCHRNNSSRLRTQHGSNSLAKAANGICAVFTPSSERKSPAKQLDCLFKHTAHQTSPTSYPSTLQIYAKVTPYSEPNQPTLFCC